MINPLRKTRSTGGFTLIELMVIVVIMGVVAAMAGPRFDIAFERIRFRSANRDIISAIKVARSRAITYKQQHGIYFNGTDMTITVFCDTINPTGYQYDSDDEIISVDTLSRQLSYIGTNFSGNSMVFSPNGSAHFTVSGGGEASISTLVETDRLVAYQTHSVLASTGRINSTSHYY
ncbi:MAG: prepilin-type N-terminal cleavage/methylation domain-containing protein [candidate division Zixibacteria bacterium]|nr:prepilin-type N-terminal cleavage/methylation domain-containing protein [candidate division Zixibacteria bacterium]